MVLGTLLRHTVSIVSALSGISFSFCVFVHGVLVDDRTGAVSVLTNVVYECMLQ